MLHAFEVEISSVARSKLLWLLVLTQFFQNAGCARSLDQQVTYALMLLL